MALIVPTIDPRSWHWDLLAAFGFCAQALFAARFIIQWIASERRRASHIPVGFWWLSQTRYANPDSSDSSDSRPINVRSASLLKRPTLNRVVATRKRTSTDSFVSNSSALRLLPSLRRPARRNISIALARTLPDSCDKRRTNACSVFPSNWPTCSNVSAAPIRTSGDSSPRNALKADRKSSSVIAVRMAFPAKWSSTPMPLVVNDLRTLRTT